MTSELEDSGVDGRWNLAKALLMQMILGRMEEFYHTQRTVTFLKHREQFFFPAVSPLNPEVLP